MKKQRTLLILSLVLNLLLTILSAIFILLYFDFFNIGKRVEEENNTENIVFEEGSNDSENIIEKESIGTGEDSNSGKKQTVVIEEEGDEENNKYEDWTTYTNNEMGFLIKYPNTFTYDGEEIRLTLVEQEHYNTGEVNCIFISGPVDNYEEAGLSIGYDPVNSGPNNCFRSGVGGGEQSLEDVDIQVGSQNISARKLSYIGEEDEQSYINYTLQLEENPNMNNEDYNYFGVQIEYYFENEDMYKEVFEEILKTFEWL
jgi:hypothetical protein